MTGPNYDNYSIIPFNGLTRVLFLREDAGWTLPHHHSDSAKEINAAMQEQLGLSTIVLRVPTTRGNLYFKATAPASAFELALTTKLYQLFPGQVPPVLVIDEQR